MMGVDARTQSMQTKEPGHRSTGLPGLDGLIGGMPAGIHLLVAEPGDAQELFLMHFANTGTPTTYCTTDRTPGELEDTWAAYGHDGAQTTIRPLAGKPPSPTDQRFVFDSLSSFRHDSGWKACLQTVAQVRAYLQGSGHPALFQVMPSMHPPEEVTRLMAMADGVFWLETQRNGNADQLTLQVRKMRSMQAPRRHLPVTVQHHGLKVETVSRVF